MEGIYYIENSKSEFMSDIEGYFATEQDAREALKECCDWYRPKGTGAIYFVPFGLDKRSKLIYRNS